MSTSEHAESETSPRNGFTYTSLIGAPRILHSPDSRHHRPHQEQHHEQIRSPHATSNSKRSFYEKLLVAQRKHNGVHPRLNSIRYHHVPKPSHWPDDLPYLSFGYFPIDNYQWGLYFDINEVPRCRSFGGPKHLPEGALGICPHCYQNMHELYRGVEEEYHEHKRNHPDSAAPIASVTFSSNSLRTNNNNNNNNDSNTKITVTTASEASNRSIESSTEGLGGGRLAPLVAWGALGALGLTGLALAGTRPAYRDVDDYPTYIPPPIYYGRHRYPYPYRSYYPPHYYPHHEPHHEPHHLHDSVHRNHALGHHHH